VVRRILFLNVFAQKWRSVGAVAGGLGAEHEKANTYKYTENHCNQKDGVEALLLI